MVTQGVRERERDREQECERDREKRAQHTNMHARHNTKETHIEIKCIINTFAHKARIFAQVLTAAAAAAATAIKRKVR